MTKPIKEISASCELRRVAFRPQTPLSAPNFLLYWLEINRDTFKKYDDQNRSAPPGISEINHYPSQEVCLDKGYELVGINGSATREELFEIFDEYFKRVGREWFWDQRVGYIHENNFGPKIDELMDRLADSESQLFIMEHNDQRVGFCFISKPKDKPGVIEIEKIGLFPEHQGSSHAKYLLPMIFRELFDDCGYDKVELNTRSTNQFGIVEFYEYMGMTCRETLLMPSDIMKPQYFEAWKTSRLKYLAQQHS